MDSLTKYHSLTAHCPVILPSLLACDFANLEREIRSVEEAGAQALHLDIMDGHFVPNISIGIPVVECVRKITDLVLDVHLMLSFPEAYVEAFRKAGADGITFHVEAIMDQVVPGKNFARNGCQKSDIPSGDHPAVRRTTEVLGKIHSLGAAAGLSIIPPTNVEVLAHWTEVCDNVLIMSVMPGFGGQSFDRSALDKLRWLRHNASPKTLRSVDGGVNETTLPECIFAGATGLIMGTAVFKNPDRQQQMKTLQKMMENV